MQVITILYVFLIARPFVWHYFWLRTYEKLKIYAFVEYICTYACMYVWYLKFKLKTTNLLKLVVTIRKS